MRCSSMVEPATVNRVVKSSSLFIAAYYLSKIIFRSLKMSCRKNAARKGISTKRANLLKYVESVEITVKDVNPVRLLDRACYHWNRRRKEKELWDRPIATRESPRDFMDRISVNYIRHNHTNYHEILREIKGRVGTNDAYLVLRKRIFEEIARMYEWLRPECERQMINRENERNGV